MIVSARTRIGVPFDVLMQRTQLFTQALPPFFPARRAAEEILRDMLHMQLDHIEYQQEDAVVIMAARASDKLMHALKEAERDMQVIDFLRTFIGSAMGHIFPDVKIKCIWENIQAAFRENPPPSGLEGFSYGVVMANIYGDIRKLSALCTIDDLREVILAHIDVISTRPEKEATLKEKKAVIHAFARCLGVFH